MKTIYEVGNIVQINLSFKNALYYLKDGYILTSNNITMYICGDELHMKVDEENAIVSTGNIWNVNTLNKIYICERCGFKSNEKESVEICEQKHYTVDTCDVKYFFAERSTLPTLITLTGIDGKFVYRLEGKS